MPKLPPKTGVRIDRINTLLIDGNALFKRGYHGSHDAYNEDGDHVGGIYQFITVLRMLLTRDVFHNVYVFWDGKFSGKLRWELYKDYKGDRGKDYINGTEPDNIDEKFQQFKVKQYLYHLSIRQIEDPVVEADDYIAYYCNNKQENEDITICTSDRDIVQLIAEDIKIWLCDLKEYVVLGNYSLYFKHHPDNVALIKTIVGDASDTIKGVKGVGEKTLLTLFPFLTERKSDLFEVLEEALKLQKVRTVDKKKPLGALTNILEGKTDGVQGDNLYEINQKLVDLTTPLMTNSSIEHYDDVINTPLSDDRNQKEVYKMLKRDGVDDMIRDYRMTDYFLPFKKLKDRERRMSKEQEQHDNRSRTNEHQRKIV